MFYELVKPYYETDYASKRANPVKRLNRHSVPSMKCPLCDHGEGAIWACFGHLPLRLPDNGRIYELLRPTILPLDDNIAVRREIAELLELDFDLIKPGMTIGLPSLEIYNSDFGDFIHPFPGIIVCRDRPKTIFEDHGVNGVTFIPVETKWKLGKSNSNEMPTLWQFYPEGKAWRVGDDVNNTTICENCGRRVMPQLAHMQIDESRYDGTDVFFVDDCMNRVFVTEKVKHIVDANQLSNIVCAPIS